MTTLDSRRLLEIMETAKIFGKRDSIADERPNDGPDSVDGWWVSSTAYIVKWALVGGLFLIFLACFVGGYLHAKRRIRKGLPLLPYHRWLVPRNQQPGYRSAYPTQPTYIPYGKPEQQYPEPPPLYDGNELPPVYTRPQKVPLDPEQGLATSTAPPPPLNKGTAPTRPISRP